ncbi:YD repeat-containing protein [Kribbella sp. VKM Ac-2527]|uniref:YD repeat-containing protein n=1 Tax=Kribbella caucasensis TaxID=2512215 RepID=A0A4R6JGT5_9ACTN|nr:DUF6531 domain-containing protein [Kribbella sp. VKM Ac-2527]TDO35250.1 YD repeat-containing protein [Kribbella sp. VKM Ac-2527]
MTSSFRRALCAILALLLLIPWTTPPSATAEDGTCIHVDVRVSAGGELLSKGAEIAGDGGFGHAGTGQTFTFQAQLFPTAPQDQCNLWFADARSWSVTSWPCENYPKPQPARSQSLVWSVTVPLDCQVFSSPGLLAASTTNGRASAGGNVLIYAGAPGFVLPYQQARGLFGPFAMQSDPVNSLTGALATVSTDAAAPGLGVPLTATRTYNSNDTDPGPLGPGWRPSYSDRLVLESGGARYLASDGRQIAFSRKGSGFAIEPGAARFTLARSGDGYVLTDFDQLRMRFSAAGELQSIRDRDNQGVVVTHSGGRVASVANGRRSLTYVYNEVGLISTITLTGPGVEPRVIRYDYAGGRLTGVTSPGGVKTRYEYDGAGRLRSECHGDAARAAVTTEYDQDGPGDGSNRRQGCGEHVDLGIGRHPRQVDDD